jgi:hypothetical protein
VAVKVIAVPLFCGLAALEVRVALVTGADDGVSTTYAICAEACAASPALGCTGPTFVKVISSMVASVPYI